MEIDTKIKNQISQISEKISLLKNKDVGLKVFGASEHKYKFNPTLSEEEISQYEQENGIKLPPEHRAFISLIGNGGAGPYYGLVPLEDGRYSDLTYKNEDDLIDLSKPFPHTEQWNEWESPDYTDNKWTAGFLKIANYGCGVYIGLIVNGAEYGNIWVVDFANDYGVFPDPFFDPDNKMTFLNWYEFWLDSELAKY